MFATQPIRFLGVLLLLASVSSVCSTALAQSNKIMGQVQFSGVTRVERDSGLWIDGQYLGYLKELKGNKKVMLLPGNHEVVIRQAGYQTLTKDFVVEPGKVQFFTVTMHKDPAAIYPSAGAATLDLTVTPGRAAVFVDDGYVGHAGDFGGTFHSMEVSPGTHRIKIELPGYKTFETEINAPAGQKAEIKTDLEKGSIEEAGALIKQQ
jgi:hypothetical protein